jgi:hypothetical protein
MHQCVAPPRPLGQRINIDIDNVSAICQPEPLLKYLLPMTNSGTNNKKANGVKRSMQRGAIHADVNHHAAHYFYDQVLINQPTDLNFAVETDSDWCGMGDRSVVVVSGEQQSNQPTAASTRPRGTRRVLPTVDLVIHCSRGRAA